MAFVTFAVASVVLLLTDVSFAQQNNRITLGLLFAEKMDDGSTDKFAFETSAAAVTMALSRVKNEELLPHVEFKIKWHFSNCDESLAAGLAYKMIHEENVDVIIGPPCDRAALMTATVAAYFNVPLLSWAATITALENMVRYPTVIQTIGSANRLAHAVELYLHHFNWMRVALYYTDDEQARGCYRLAHRLQQNLPKSSILINYYVTIVRKSPTHEENLEFLNALPNYARVTIVCLDSGITDFMMTVHELGLHSNPEYVFLLPRYLRTERETEPWKFQGFDNKEMRQAKSAFQNALWIDMKLATGERLQYFRRTVPVKMSEAPFYYHQSGEMQQGSLFSPFLFDSVYLYAKIVNDTHKRGYDHRDGEAIVRRAPKFKFDGVSGAMFFDQSSTRQPEFALRGFDMDQELVEFAVARLQRNTTRKIDNLLTIGQMFGHPHRHGFIPTGAPLCGWKGELCDDDARTAALTIAILAAVGAGILTIMLLGMTIFIRRRIQKSEMAHLEWKMTIKDVIPLKKMKGSSGSMSSGKSSIFNEEMQEAISRNSDQTADYKGMLVWMKNHKCNIVMTTKEDHDHMRAMKALTDENLNYFVGLCLDSRVPVSVWLYCAKNSLEDILANDTIKLDWFFKFSFMRDLANGLEALHASPIKTHSRLKSSNCLIDNRWVLRVTDFGLHMMNEGKVVEMRDRLWLSPELLRNSHPPLGGSQRGDVYAFAIIISEIISREKPFASYDVSHEEAVGCVRRGEDPPFRPDVSDHLNDPEVDMRIIRMMQDCWNETPTQRLAMKDVKSLIRTIGKGQSSNLMDHALRMMEQYAKTLEAQVGHRTAELAMAYERSDKLLAAMMPKSVAEKLKAGIKVEPENFECVSIFFSDVHQFAQLIARSKPLQIIAMLNQLYTCLDAIIDEYDVYKVETINDSYMVASGLPHRNGDQHAVQIADMALHFQIAIQSFSVPHLPNDKVQLRIGINTGPVTAGVVGLTAPRYCLFGDTVNVASRIETNSKPACIHLSESANNHLVNVVGGYITKPRGEIIIKGKGVMFTYWLLGKTSTGVGEAYNATEKVELKAPTTATETGGDDVASD